MKYTTKKILNMLHVCVSKYLIFFTAPHFTLFAVIFLPFIWQHCVLHIINSNLKILQYIIQYIKLSYLIVIVVTFVVSYCIAGLWLRWCDYNDPSFPLISGVVILTLNFSLSSFYLLQIYMKECPRRDLKIRAWLVKDDNI